MTLFRGHSNEVLASIQQQLEPIVPSLFKATFIGQRAKGIKKYKTELFMYNGRNPIQDLEEEMVDGAMYYAQALLENRRDEADMILEAFNDFIFEIQGNLGGKQWGKPRRN